MDSSPTWVSDKESIVTVETHGNNLIPNGGPAPQGDVASLYKQRRIGESLIQAFLFFCGAFSILITVGIVIILFRESWLFFGSDEVTLREFFTGAVWQPRLGEFGVWPLLLATLMVASIAMLFAMPFGLMIAIYLSEYAPISRRNKLKPTLELLAGIPTVIYGYFALNFITPLLRGILGDDVVQIYNQASAGIVIGILITPLIATMSEDALRAVPSGLREAAYGLGATRLEVVMRVVVPAALSGLSAAFIIAMSRSIGETMVAAIAAGAGPNLTLNPFEAAETMTGYIARISGGDLAYDTLDYNSIFAIGLLLFVMTLTLNIISRRIMRRFREEYQ